MSAQVGIPLKPFVKLFHAHQMFKVALSMHERSSREPGDPPLTEEERVEYHKWYCMYEESQDLVQERLDLFMAAVETHMGHLVVNVTESQEC